MNLCKFTNRKNAIHKRVWKGSRDHPGPIRSPDHCYVCKFISSIQFCTNTVCFVFISVLNDQFLFWIPYSWWTTGKGDRVHKEIPWRWLWCNKWASYSDTKHRGNKYLKSQGNEAALGGLDSCHKCLSGNIWTVS